MGAEGTFQFSSVYESFTKPSSVDENLPGNCIISTRNQTEQTKSSNPIHQQECKFSANTYSSNSLSSSSSSQSSTLSFGCSSGSKQSTHAPQLVVKQEAAKLERENSQIDLQLLSQQPPSHKALGEQSSLENPSQSKMKRSGGFKVKAFCGEEKVRFKFQPTWSFQELKKEMMNRFNISDTCSVDLKYLDDDAEWVLLTLSSPSHLDMIVSFHNGITENKALLGLHYTICADTRS